jgi:hypothetical protein
LWTGNSYNLRTGIKGLPDPNSTGAVITPAQDIGKEISSPSSTAKGIFVLIFSFNQINAY